MAMRRGFGWLPDLPKRSEGRADWHFGEQLARAPARQQLPAAHSNRRLIVDVLDQGDLGACVACAGFQAIRMAEVRQGAKAPRLGARLFNYYLARAAHGMAGFDAGAQLRTFFWTLNRYGFLYEDEYPFGYDIRRFAEKPPVVSYTRASDRKSPTRYWGILEGPERISQIKRAISLGYGVTFGVQVDDAFADWKTDPTKPLDPPIGGVTYGHAMLVEGYDGDAFTVLNSWGEEYGACGRCLLSADYLNSAHSIWVVENVPRGLR
jgi:C1A family cysteine protease